MISLALAAALMLEPTSTPVMLETWPAPLHGTLLRPEGQIVATAVIIPGSGPTDRDGNSPMGVRNGALKQLAEGLAAQGVASVRIDKRGIAQSRAAGPDESQLSIDAFIKDAGHWAELAMQETGSPCVWLIGHSEGALVAQSAASGNDTHICGQVLVAGAGRPAGVVLREQIKGQIPEDGMALVETLLSELEAGRLVENPPAVLQALFRPSVQPYLISWLTRDPAELARTYEGPMFIGQGTTDLQTTVSDAQALHDAQPRSQLKIWEGVNHVLVEVSADYYENMVTYGNADAKIAPQVVEDVAAFIKANTR